jgi:large subunit ribosomal protein L30
MLQIQQYRSVIRTPRSQRRILASLGLKRLNQIRMVSAVPTIMGMLRKVPHLVRILDSKEA